MASRSWSKYEHQLAYLKPPPFEPDTKSDEESALLEAYYFAHNAWLKPELLLETAKKIYQPVLLVQGRYDMVCPVSSAVKLKEVIPHAKLHLVTAGHAMREKTIVRTLRREIAGLIA
jgi:proline iminopeptidase